MPKKSASENTPESAQMDAMLASILPKLMEESSAQTAKIVMKELARYKRELSRKHQNSSTADSIAKLIWENSTFALCEDTYIYVQPNNLPGVVLRGNPSQHNYYSLFDWILNISEKNGRSVSSQIISDGINKYLSQATTHQRNSAKSTVPIFARWGYTQDSNGELTFYYDLANAENQMVEITRNGPRITTHNLSAVFDNTRHSKLPAPKIELTSSSDRFVGSLHGLEDLLNIETENITLLKGAIFQLFSPSGPYMHILFSGPPGSAKSTAMHIIKSILDNRKFLSVGMPTAKEQLARHLDNVQLPTFDNVKEIRRSLIETLSYASTGNTSESIKKNYTDKDEVPLFIHKGIMLTSSDPIISAQELIDRFIFIYMNRLLDNEYKSDRTLEKLKKDLAPQILGALFNGVCESLNYIHNNNELYKTRMNTPLEWVDGAYNSLEITQGEFTENYLASKNHDYQDIGVDNALVNAIYKFLILCPNYESLSTFNETLQTINHLIYRKSIVLEPYQILPRNYKAFAAQIDEWGRTLEQHGIHSQRIKAGSQRNLLLLKFTEEKIRNLTDYEKGINDTVNSEIILEEGKIHLEPKYGTK